MPITWQAFDTFPSSSARFSSPVLCLMVFSEVFNIVASFDGLVRTTIKTDNHHLLQEMCRPHSSLLGRGRCQITSRLIQLDIRDTTVSVGSDYNTSSVQLGLAITGYREFSRFELRPELSLAYGYTDVGNVALDISTANSTLQDTLDAGSIELGRLSFEPEFFFPLNAPSSLYYEATFRVTPTLTCEYLRTTSSRQDCGGGLRLEWNVSSFDALNEFSIRASREVIGGTSRNSIGLQFESQF
ncbi:hypothetical protein N9L47_08670 [Rhodobacteraceae bacterium]|nr:hypothetical protein [Paracoccaceae bacterium]